MRKENKLAVGIIGVGKMGTQHLKVIAGLGNAKIIGIADPRANADKVGEITGKQVKIFFSAEEFFKNGCPDVVHVVTPPGTHYEYGRMALENGSHVFIEKPFVLEGFQAEELMRIARNRGLKLIAGHQLLAQNVTRKAEQCVKNIGEIIHIESYFAFRKVRKSLSPVDQAIDILPHPTYTLLHFLRTDKNSEDRFTISALNTGADGEVRAVIENGGRRGFLLVSLRGRPVDSYLKIVGTYGSVYVDYVRGVVINLSGSGGDAISAILTPYRQAWQTAWNTTKALAGLTTKKNRTYEGLAELIESFYMSILEDKEPPIKPDSIITTVRICERIGAELKEKEREAEKRARVLLDEKTKGLAPIKTGESVLVTGGNGFLGRVICRELRSAGWPVKSISRSLTRFSDREPGIEYEALDLADGMSPDVLRGASAVIHCAVETSGGKEDHQRNSVDATRKLLEAAAAAGVKKFIHISSLAVLKPGKNSGRTLDETSPVDHDNFGRGPYVWGKAKAEKIAVSLSKQLGINLKIIRPGPLVDFENFEPPGRLGREVGPYFVVMGSRRSPLSVCGVRTVAKVIKNYLDDYGLAPPLLNLTEPDVPTRRDLVLRLLEKRRDLKVLYIPTFSIRILSFGFKVLQKLIRPSQKALDVAAAFSSERYDTDLARQVISKASLS